MAARPDPAAIFRSRHRRLRLFVYARLSTDAQHTLRRSLPHARAQARRARHGRALLPLRRTEPHHTTALGARPRSTVRHLQERADGRASRARLHTRREAPASAHAALLREGLPRVRLLARHAARLRPRAPTARAQDGLDRRGTRLRSRTYVPTPEPALLRRRDRTADPHLVATPHAHNTRPPRRSTRHNRHQQDARLARSARVVRRVHPLPRDASHQAPRAPHQRQALLPHQSLPRRRAALPALPRGAALARPDSPPATHAPRTRGVKDNFSTRSFSSPARFFRPQIPRNSPSKF